MRNDKMKNLRNLAFWLIPPNLLLTSMAHDQSDEKNQGTSSEAFTTQPSKSSTPAVAPIMNRCVNFTTTADFIWWKTHLSNMEYAWAGITDTKLVPFNELPLKGNIKQPAFKFTPGFKVGLGLDFRHDGWDIYSRYTWLDGAGTARTTGRTDVGLMSTFPRGVFIDIIGGDFQPTPISEAKCRWQQHFNVIDLELGRNFFISRFLTLRPFFGLKTDWIKEEFRTAYVVNDPPGNTPPNTIAALTYQVKRNEEVWGIGIRAGLNSVWHFTKNWGLYGDIAATALWSDFHLKLHDSYVYDSTVSGREHLEQTTINTGEKIQQLTPVIEASLGLMYMLWFNDDKCLFYTKAGWEEQI